MPASKKRIKLRSGATAPEQKVPAALRDWVHIWHGVSVHNDPADESAIFHAGSRVEELSFWQQFVRLPSNSLFPRVDTIANPRRQYKDFLYVLLNLRWPVLFTVLLGVFVINIFFFALVVCYGCREPEVFLKAFDLSYQTFTTIGFGIVFPKQTCSNIVIALESFASMLITSAITGLVFAKFAKPIAKIAFSKVCVVQPYGNEHLALVVRVANATQSRDVTHDVIMETNFKLNLLRVEHNSRSGPHVPSSSGRRPPVSGTSDGSQTITSNNSSSNNSSTSTGGNNKSLRSYNLKILQNNFITFRMGIAVVHVIGADSPFYGMSEQEILESDMILEVAMSGVDSTLQDTVAERFMYTASDIKWGYRFAELLDFDERNMEVIMNFAKLSSIELAPIDDATYVHPAAAYARHHFYTSSSSSTGSSSSRAKLRDSLGPIDELTATPEPIDELGAEDPEVFRRQRSTSEGSGIAERVMKHVPSKCSMGMEPLFEPLLQHPVGTQRLRTTNTSGSTAADASRPGRYQRLQSGPAALERDREGANTGEFILPIPQKRQIQGQLAGEAVVQDEDETSTISDLEDGYDDCDSDNGGGGDYNEMERRPSKGAHSVLSIDVEDTPRFLRISPLNIPKTYDFMRLYHSALYVKWPRIIFMFVLMFLGINLVFGLLYWFKEADIDWYPEVTVTKFELAVFMSVQTFSTIGYGSIAPSPSSLYMNFWVLVESCLGIIATTIITGIAWSKFARPRAHIHFSAKIAICRIYGHRCLVFRAANTRHSGDVHENFFRIGVILTNRMTGLRQMYDVPLVTAEWPSIKLPATLIHIIDRSSPFYKFQSVDDLSKSRVAVIALLTGLDTTFSENVYARKMYFWDDFTVDMRFDDFACVERDCVIVDYERFDKLVPEVPTSMTSL